jgi:hypothetical protein
MTSSATASRAAETPQIWLVRETDHFRAGQHLLAIVRPEGTVLLEHAGWKALKPVDAVLALAGFQPGEASTLSARTVRDKDVRFEKLRGFAAPEAAIARAEMAARELLGGVSGGFMPLHTQQTGFGCSVAVTLAFERAWDVAGRPPILVRSGTFSADTGGQLLDIHGSAAANPSMFATRFRHDDEIQDEGGQPVQSGALTAQAIGARLPDRVVPETKPCPFCSRPMVKIKGVFMCIQALKEQSAASAGQTP